MKLLKDPYFEGGKQIETKEIAQENLELFFDEIRGFVSDVMIHARSLIEQDAIRGETNYETNIREYIKEKRKNFPDNGFIQKFFDGGFRTKKGEIVFASRYYDESLETISDKVEEKDEKVFDKLSREYKSYGGTMLWGDEPEPHDLWYFSDMAELEDGFIYYYEKFKKISFGYGTDIKKILFKKDKNIGKYTKTLYMKGDFSTDSSNSGGIMGKTISFFKDLEKNGLINDLKIQSESSQEDIEYRNILNFRLKDKTKLNIYIKNVNKEDSKVILSLEEKYTSLELQNFLYKCFKIVEENLMDNVKNNVGNILLNFSNIDGNMINKYNYWALTKGPESKIKKIGIKVGNTILRITGDQELLKLLQNTSPSYLDFMFTKGSKEKRYLYFNPKEEKLTVELDGYGGQSYDYEQVGLDIDENKFYLKSMR